MFDIFGEVCKRDLLPLSSVCIATAFVPKVESGEQADMPKVELGGERVKHVYFMKPKLVEDVWYTPFINQHRQLEKYLCCGCDVGRWTIKYGYVGDLNVTLTCYMYADEKNRMQSILN